MADHLGVDPSTLDATAANFDERGQGWRSVGANPPNDPDQLTEELGFVGHAVVEGVRADNARRHRDTEKFAAANSDLAENLRGAARDYRRADDEGAAGAGAVNLPD
ncbi:type VII secretion target [Mycobacteroides salmoniphilum]|uniref:ESX-1 secretion-associated protein n=1 Tax=Mycobacteroides salmoniphilum TaxID=404941 RepID=A0A4V3I1F6_9MYCO|nr:type VII secretion target [Mycobacteroides salmoniphilum]TEA09224.1 hypothetical protein CCUG60884_00214 [Mycobacteroides salmoniphilum]